MKNKTTMTDHKYHTVSIEDREMFARNARYEKMQQHLAQPENRIRYCYEFMQDNFDAQIVKHAFENYLLYISQAEGEGSDY